MAVHAVAKVRDPGKTKLHRVTTGRVFYCFEDED